MKTWILIIAVIAAGGFGYYQFRRGGLRQGRPQETAREVTKPVEMKSINLSVGLAGEIGPAEQVSVRPEVNGRINEMPVDVGDRVKAGSLLFSLDDKDLTIEISTRQTEINAARIQLERTRRDYDRDDRLFKENLIPKESFENSKTEFELAQNSIRKAEAAHELAAERVTKTKVRAPFDCTILTRPVSVGQAVSGSGGFNSGTEVLTIADLNRMVINAHVNQADVTRLRQGLAVSIEVEAVAGLRVTGEIERIAPQATVKNGIKGFAVRIALTESSPAIQPGMTANISVPVAAAQNVLAIPLAAVFTEDGSRYAYVKTEGLSAERRLIQIGISDYFVAEVKSGLIEGELVYVELPPEMALEKTKKGNQGGASAGGGSGTATAPGAGSKPAVGSPPRSGTVPPVKPAVPARASGPST